MVLWCQKIAANAKVLKNIDPINPTVYQRALTKGVAHAKGTVLPGEGGNMFLFAHSSDNFYNANRYNSVFYLLNKLEPGDEIYIYYEGVKYTYTTTKKKIVNPEQVSYLRGKGTQEKLILMTCWPAGTTLKRLVIEAEAK
ncbi:MAG: Sortase family protein [Microgenomates bacterium OLB23]|nr:MAG: Sortase family protein [Microgenomates bacterium OLB23]